MVLNERQQLEHKSRMLSGGFIKDDCKYFDSKSYKKLKETMVNTLKVDNRNQIISKFTLYPKSKIISDGKYVINKHFRNIDLKVNYTNCEDFESVIFARFGKNPKPEEHDNIINYINNNIDRINVTDIPVDIQLFCTLDGRTIHTWFYPIDVVDENYFHNLPYCINSILLKGDCNDVLSTTYVHEMMHALTSRNKGSIENYLLNEMIPIFMEKVAAIDISNDSNLVDYVIYDRLLETKLYMMENEYSIFKDQDALGVLERNKYILSSVYATGLFNLYKNGDDNKKNNINNSIRELIKGNTTVDNILKLYNIDLDDCTEIMKKQCKVYTKKYLN